MRLLLLGGSGGVGCEASARADAKYGDMGLGTEAAKWGDTRGEATPATPLIGDPTIVLPEIACKLGIVVGIVEGTEEGIDNTVGCRFRAGAQGTICEGCETFISGMGTPSFSSLFRFSCVVLSLLSTLGVSMGGCRKVVVWDCSGCEMSKVNFVSV